MFTASRYRIASMHVLIEEMPQPAHHVHLNRPLNGILPLSITGVGLNALAFNALMHATVRSHSPLSMASGHVVAQPSGTRSIVKIGISPLEEVAVGVPKPVQAVEIEEVTCTWLVAVIGSSVLVQLEVVVVSVEIVSAARDSVEYRNWDSYAVTLGGLTNGGPRMAEVRVGIEGIA
jgi:hypothetical protein